MYIIDNIIDYLDERKTKTYPFKRESLLKMKYDKKAEKIGTGTSVIIYLILAYFIIIGTLGQEFIMSYIASKVASSTVKSIMR